MTIFYILIGILIILFGIMLMFRISETVGNNHMALENRKKICTIPVRFKVLDYKIDVIPYKHYNLYRHMIRYSYETPGGEKIDFVDITQKNPSRVNEADMVLLCDSAYTTNWLSPLMELTNSRTAKPLLKVIGFCFVIFGVYLIFSVF